MNEGTNERTLKVHGLVLPLVRTNCSLFGNEHQPTLAVLDSAILEQQ